MAPAPMTKHYYISWEQMQRDAETLARHLASKGPWKGIVAVTRGGLAPVSVLSRDMGIREIRAVTTDGYTQGRGEHSAQPEPRLTDCPSDIGEGEGWLIVDDMSASGRTAELLRRRFPKAHIAVLYIREPGKKWVDSFVQEIDPGAWIYLPWYKEMRMAALIANAAEAS